MAEKKGCVLSEVLKNQVHERFDRLKQTLDIREKILLRQIDVLVGHQAHMMIENIEFIAENEFDMLKRITSFGKFSIKHFQIQDDCMGVEEYIDKDQDHHEECKAIGGIGHRHCVPASETLKMPKTCHADIIHNNRHHLSTSPPNVLGHQTHQNAKIGDTGAEKNIHITINDEILNDKSCIDLTTTTTTKTTTSNNNNNNDNSEKMLNSRHKYVKICENAIESTGCMGRKSKQNKQQHTISIATTTQTSTQTDPHHHPPTPASSHHAHHQQQHRNGPLGHNHPELDSNNQVLKNISNLTMTNANGTINLKNISNLTINSAACNRFKVDKEHIHHTENHRNLSSTEPNPECGFYDRLITENKHLQYKLMENAFGKKVYTPASHGGDLNYHPHEAACTGGPEKLPVGDEKSNDQPIQVQQWLKQIIYETETEPIINSEFMEYINIQR
uniref:CSON006558 protein n=1 Tax=Culicoides sonorensis TaxID=179676 RepID=A0A336MTS0_CULSO